MDGVPKVQSPPTQDWGKVLPSRTKLALKVTCVVIVILGNLAGVGYGLYELTPYLKDLKEVMDGAEYITHGSISLVTIFAIRYLRNWKDLPGGVTERAIKQYTGLDFLLMGLSLIVIGPTFLFYSWIDRINYANKTLVSSISEDLRKREFKEIAVGYRTLNYEYFLKDYDKNEVTDTDVDANGKPKSIPVTRDGKQVSIKQWLKEAIPLMNQLVVDLAKHNASVGKREQGTAVKKITTGFEEKITQLNDEWKVIRKNCFDADKIAGDSGWLERTFLESTPPDFDGKKAA